MDNLTVEKKEEEEEERKIFSNDLMKKKKKKKYTDRKFEVCVSIEMKGS